MFVGTPQDTKVENLEKPLGKPRPPFLAPEGTVLLSKGKPVSASDEEPIIGDIDYITDGDKEAADGSYVELAPFVQHVTVDLGKESEIYAIVLWHYHKQPRVYYDVVVQLANDKDSSRTSRRVQQRHRQLRRPGHRQEHALHGDLGRPAHRLPVPGQPEGPVRPSVQQRQHQQRAEPLHRG